MREHMGLDRGKRLYNGKWIEGYYVRLFDGKGNVSHRIYSGYAETDCGEFYPDWFGVDPETVGECTGLKDKNGMLIFEGDILKFEYTGRNMGVHGKAAVVFEHGQFGVRWGWHKDFVPLDGFCNTTVEIIGNVHDNPELLEGGAEYAAD